MCCLPKQRLGPKLEGAGLGEHPKNGNPVCISTIFTPLKLATSNIVHNLGLAYQKQRLGPELAGVWARGASEKNVGLPIYFCNR